MPQGLFAVAPDGRIAHINATLAQWLRLRPEAGQALTLLDIVSGDGAALIRVGRRAAGRTTRLDLDLLREDGRALPAQLDLPRAQAAGRHLRAGARPQRGRAPASSAGPDEARLTRVFQSAPFGIATARRRRAASSTANAAFMRMFSSRRPRAAPATLPTLCPDGEEAAGRELAKALAARRLRPRRRGTPIEVSFGVRSASWRGASM